MGNYTITHCHSSLSLLDSCTDYKDYIDKCVELGQNAIAVTEHGNIYNWVAKKLYCKEKGIKYLHGCEVYLTENPNEKVRDNYHTILIAKNYEGVKELNALVSASWDDKHFYYKPRITFDEFLSSSDNIISTSACLASPLSKLPLNNSYYDKLCKKYTYFELQPHDCDEQREFNKRLVELSLKYNKPLIVGTDTHSLNKYKAECRGILQKSKGIEFTNEDSFDLTYKTYDELVEMFKKQGAVEESVFLEAIENTNKLADTVEDFELDTSIKYPKLYDNEIEIFEKRVWDMFNTKILQGVIPGSQKRQFEEQLEEEIRVFKKLNMCSFMLFMSEMAEWCRKNNIPYGFGRGSVAGSCVAYVTGIIDVNPVKWNTIFSRFCNEYRTEIGDIDMDYAPSDRDKVYNYIINRFGKEYTGYILSVGTLQEKGAIDMIGKALKYPIPDVEKIKNEYAKNPDEAKSKYNDLFYYFDGIVGCPISQSLHPAGIIAAPMQLNKEYGFCTREDKPVLQIDMDCCHELGLAKYDILGLINIQIVSDCCKLAGINYPKAHEINWDDEKVWNDMRKSSVGIFQFEGDYAFNMLKKFNTSSIFDMSIVNAAVRPSGASYRDNLIARIPNKNPSVLIDKLLENNLGYLLYQEDIIAFLQQICGMSGGEADNLRRAIARKQMDRMEAALPKVIDGYCSKSDKPRNVAEEEVKQFIQVIEDASSYMFGYNHSVAYCLLGYLCAYLRYYYPLEFVTAFLNNPQNDSDITNGTELASMLGIKIESPKFRYSLSKYQMNKENNTIYKGMESIKFISAGVANCLYGLRDNQYNTFIDLLYDLKGKLDTRQIDILIKLDYFSEFGNSKFLTKITEMVDMFKCGLAKQMDKSKIDDEFVKSIISRNSKHTEKLFKEIDCQTVMNELYEYYKATITEDYSIKEKIKWQQEYIGYVDIKSSNPDDRFKLIVTGIKPLKTKDKTRTWAYALNCVSLYTSKSNELLVYERTFTQNPLEENTIIQASPNCLTKKVYNDRVSWYLSNYIKCE